jgi:hypothetical protein
MVVACQIFSRVFWISVKRCTSQKVWESVGNPGIVENSSDFKWIKSSLGKEEFILLNMFEAGVAEQKWRNETFLFRCNSF